MKSGPIINHIVKWLSDYCNKARMEGFVVGVSGGIDSAVTSSLCAKTGKKVILLKQLGDLSAGVAKKIQRQRQIFAGEQVIL